MAQWLALCLSSATIMGAGAVAPPDPAEPPNVHELECAVHAFAHAFGVAKVPSAGPALADALHLDSCNFPLASSATAGAGTPIRSAPLQAASAQITLIRERARVQPAHRGHQPWQHLVEAVRRTAPSTHFFVATTGDDTASGTSATTPFATFARAAAAARAATVKPVTVTVAAGKYYFSSTLTLGRDDSDVTWQAASGAAVTLSGGARLEPRWRPSKLGRGILEADVNQSLGVVSDEERAFWTLHTSAPRGARTSTMSSPSPRSSSPLSSSSSPPPGPPHTWGAPPARWNTLHMDGVRQVRARAPNANPQDNTGICFSKAQREGEGCAGWFEASGQLGTLPSSTKVADIVSDTDRNKAPASPTDGGGSCGTFQCTIYDPPKGHPVCVDFCPPPPPPAQRQATGNHVFSWPWSPRPCIVLTWLATCVEIFF
jgi:hypothetical protein